MSEKPWRERLGLGVALVDEPGENWVPIEGEDFFERLELAGSLTRELGAEWVAVFCQFDVAGAFSSLELARTLGLDRNLAARCVERLAQEGLIEETSLKGVYVLAARRRSGHSKQSGTRG